MFKELEKFWKKRGAKIALWVILLPIVLAVIIILLDFGSYISSGGTFLGDVITGLLGWLADVLEKLGEILSNALVLLAKLIRSYVDFVQRIWEKIREHMPD